MPDPVYGYQYSPYQISSNPLVNSGYGFINRMMGMEAPQLTTGMNPSDVYYSYHAGGRVLDAARQQMANAVNPIFDMMKAAGGGSLVDQARQSFGPAASAYLSNLPTVQKAMGGNIDLYTRKIIASATSTMTPIMPMAGMAGRHIYHDDASQAAGLFGASVLQDIYRGGVTPDRTLTRGFKVEEIADVITSLGQEGKLRNSDIARGLRTGDQDLVDRAIDSNKQALGKRMEMLSAARNVFGAKGASALQADVSDLLGAMGTDDSMAGRTLEKISAMAKSLNLDVKAMTESRKVLSETFRALDAQMDVSGGLAGVGNKSRFGMDVAAGQAVGDMIDVMTFDMTGPGQAQARADLGKAFAQARNTSAGRLSRIMRMAEATGGLDPGAMKDFTQAMRTGDIGAATDIARRAAENSGLGDIDQIINDPQQFANALGHLALEIKDQYGEEEGNKRIQDAQQRIATDIAFGRPGQRDNLYQAGRMRDMQREIRDLSRQSGISLPRRSSEERQALYKRDLEDAARKEFDTRMENAKSDEERDAIQQEKEAAMAQISALDGTVSSMQRSVASGDLIGISGEVGSKITRSAAERGMIRDRDDMRERTRGHTANRMRVKKLMALMGNTDEARELAAKIRAAKTPEEKRKLIEQMEEMAFENEPDSLRRQYEKEVQSFETATREGQERRDKRAEHNLPSVSEQSRTESAGDRQATDTMRDRGGRIFNKKLQDNIGKTRDEDRQTRKAVEQSPHLFEKIMSGLTEHLIGGVKEGQEAAAAGVGGSVKIDDGTPIKVQVVNANMMNKPPE